MFFFRQGVNCEADDVVNIKLVTVVNKKCQYLFWVPL